MYESFYGLKEKPFNLNPDPDYIYMSEGHENTYTHLVYAISENKGFVIVTGEIGAGKTTLVNYLLHDIPAEIQIGLINNTHIPSSQFIKLVCREFELEVKGLDKAGMVDMFHDYLIEQFAGNKRVVLIIDEAQNLTPKTMEEIRLLSNLESEKHHLIQIILVGQPELRIKLQRSDLQQLVQRVTVHCHLSGLNEDDIKNYIVHRMKIGGSSKSDVFDDTAIKAIAENSRGIPRLINIICDTALVYGYADSLSSIGEQIIRDVVKERIASGLFMLPGDNGGPSADPMPEISSHGIVQAADHEYGGEIESLRDNLRRNDDRLSRLEADMIAIQTKLDLLSKDRNQRDDIIIELFKMLKGSMDSRLSTILEFSDRLK